MDRRTFLGGAVGLLSVPRCAETQPAGKIHRIGVLDTTSLALDATNVNAFRQGLQEHRYIEGQHFIFEYRSADGTTDGFPAWPPPPKSRLTTIKDRSYAELHDLEPERRA